MENKLSLKISLVKRPLLRETIIKLLFYNKQIA